MELEALALLIAVPVHEEAVLRVAREHRDDHYARDPEGRHPRQEPERQAHRSEELGGDREEAERCGKPLAEEPHRPLEAVPSEPPEGLLGAVRKDDDGEGPAEQELDEARLGPEEP